MSKGKGKSFHVPGNKNSNKKMLIDHYKYMYSKIQNITPEVYAGIALALHRKCGWGFKRINDLFNESQEIWNECVQSDKDMFQMCLEETGIDVQRKVNGNE